MQALLAEKKQSLIVSGGKPAIRKMLRVQLLTTVSNHQVYLMHCFIKHCVLYPINKSNYKLYLYCQSIPIQTVLKYFIWEICFALYMICIIVLMTEALILHTVLKDFIWERHVALYVLCVGFFLVNFLLRYQRIRVKEGNWLFSAFLRVWYVWNFESVYHLFIYFVHNSFSKMLIGFLFICLHIDLGIEKEGRGGIPRYIAYCFEIAVYFIFYVCSYNFLNS